MTNDRRSTFRCARLAAAALALGMFSVAGIGGVGAQDATPEATPAISCDSPGLPPGTATAMDTASPESMDETADMGMASPEAVDVEVATGAEADAETADAIFGAVQNYVACYNEGQATGDPGLYVALESNDFVASQGYANRFDEAQDELESPFATVTLLGIDTAMTWSDGSVSADVQALVGDHWFNEWRWFMVEEDGIWKLDSRQDLPPQPDVDFVSVNGINVSEPTDETGGFISLSGSWEFPGTDAIILNITNTGTDGHLAFVLQLPDGADPAGLFDGSLDLSTVSFIGMTNEIEPGESANIALIDLPVGTYTLVDPSTGVAQQFEVTPVEG